MNLYHFPNECIHFAKPFLPAPRQSLKVPVAEIMIFNEQLLLSEVDCLTPSKDCIRY